MPRHDNEEDNEDIANEDQDDALQDQAVLNLVFTEQQVEEYLARSEQEERELARQALEQRAHQILRERARANIRREIENGELKPRPPKTWGTYLYENTSYALHRGYDVGAYAMNKAQDFGNAYITVNTAIVAAGVVSTIAVTATKKGACVAACASKTAATVAASVNPVMVAVGGAMLVGYGIHRYNQQPIMAEVAPVNDFELGSQGISPRRSR